MVTDRAKESLGPDRRGIGLRSVALAILLAVLWWVLSGFTKPLLLGLGAASVAFCLLAAWRLGILDREGHPYRLIWAGLIYWPWLMLEIVKSNISVTKTILAPKLDIYPTLFPTRASQPDDLGQVIYANSITLTPGTISVDLEPASILVHAITVSGEEDVQSGDMDRRVNRMVGA